MSRLHLAIITLLCACTVYALPAKTGVSDTVPELPDSVGGRKVEQLREVVVTASETRGLTSGSRIDRAAMQHLQPTSFADLLELLPGNISKDPDMGSAATITLRETGGRTATGAESRLSDDYAITSLGTSFVVDGAPVSNDADLQSVPSGGDSPSAKRSVVNRGVDMRALATDNIESVEVLRGIPSAEYGNLTSGVVNIKRLRGSTPFTARFKADQYSKLFAAGKGFSTGVGRVINLDAGYLDSKADPRDNLENFKRINISGRTNMEWFTPKVQYTLRASLDFNTTIDNAKTDPDLSYNKIDEYKQTVTRYTFNAEGALRFPMLKVIDGVSLNFNAVYGRDRLERRRQVAPQRASVAPTTMSEGVHDGHYLLGEYIADFLSDGRPLTLFAKVKVSGGVSLGTVAHSYKAGVEWNFSKNYGRGQVYDLTQPLSASWTTRPRRFSEIPALNVLSSFIEDQMTWLLPQGHVLEGQAGLRTIQVTGLDSRYRLAGRVYLDPRFNLMWRLPALNAAGRDMKFHIAAGWGVSTRMPTVDYLFPQVHYNDITELNYYHAAAPLDYSRIVLRTYIENPTNYDLRPARNHKWEVRFGFDAGPWRMSATYFDERLNDGFRYSTLYRPYAFRQYDASGIDAASLTAPPDVAMLPYQDVTRLDGMSRVTNGSRIHKRGVEFTLSTPRWRPVATRLIVSGAWFRSLYSNSQQLYTPVNDVVGNVAVSDRYVGLYDTNDGRVNSQFNTNFTFDTQVPRWGLVFTTSVQCMWYVRTRRLAENGNPTCYISYIDGEVHPYTEADRNDVMLQYLVKRYNPLSFATQTVPTAVYVNFKASKKIGRILTISAFVNRIVDWLPDYKSNGLTIRRHSDAYFGMEMSLTI
ncbi:MAG: TonB-dependent receptor plug domain-containing protein [Bacteroidales bacterium]|nr:TonB-dependent receptor plug domain-containing protein [Bacteroidales bacterium]